MIKDYAFLAFDNLRHRGLRSWLTMLGIFIGIAAVISLISLGDGLKLAVNSQFGISSTQVITIQAGGVSGFGPPGTGVVNSLTRQDAEAIAELNTVKTAVPRNIRALKMEFNDKLLIGFAGTIPDDKEQREYVYETLDPEPLFGKLVETRGKVTLGYDFSIAEKSGFDKALKVGDTVTLNNESFEVQGILKKEGSFIFDKIILIMDSDLEDLLEYGDDVDLIVALVKNKEDMEKAREDIEKLLRERRDVKKGEENFEISTPETALGTINQILTGVQIFIVIIASISIIVGSVGIANTMITSVLERKKEIGTMKAIGAKNSSIFYIFVFESGMLGLVGGLVGAIFGTAAGYFGTIAISNFIGSDITPKINFVLIFGALAGSFLIGSISGILPALKAAKLNPVEALRG